MRQRKVRKRWVAATGAVALVGAVAAVSIAAESGAGAVGLAIPKQSNVGIKSFDGTNIVTNFYPAQGLTAGQTAPTVLEPSAWGLPAYGPDTVNITNAGIGSFHIDGELVGPATLTAHGYNVVTWNNRGWFGSGGATSLDSPSVEGRDVSAIINWVATQPGVQLDGPNDPLVGMTGLSYGGGVQLSAAAFDHRIDAIEPNMSWFDLVHSVYANQIIKAGWGNLLCLTGNLVGAKYDTEVTNLCKSVGNGNVTAAEIAYGNAASPGPVMGQITAPTLLLAGTGDTLFPLDGDILTYSALKSAGTPVQMVWYCGGHGICNNNPGPSTYTTTLELAFLDKYLKKQDISTGAPFQWIDQSGSWHSEADYPPGASTSVTASGSGTLGVGPFSSSGGLIAAGKASNAINIAVKAPTSPVESVTAGTLTLNYRGLATKKSTAVVAQLLDTTTGNILDDQGTAFPLILDGGSHSTTVALNINPWRFDPSSKVVLQLTDSSGLFYAQQSLGAVSISASLNLPTAPVGAAS
ncbi:X-Pro dipeptidyl-peptidase-like protein [Jatrophihabitans sp. GAS493]|nr:X-Pro dipeptidyl-peptidase-like protein [Jatrophihabitans sp. GAS493]